MTTREDKPKRLSDRIIQMEKEVGLLPMVCLESDCAVRSVTLILSKDYIGKQHCPEQIPYVKRVADKIRIIDLCTYKIEEYWK